MKEMLRRDVIRIMSLGAGSFMLMPGTTLAQTKTSFRMDEQNSIHFLAGTFIPQFLTKPSNGSRRSSPHPARAALQRSRAGHRRYYDELDLSRADCLQPVARNLSCRNGRRGQSAAVQPNSNIKSYADLKGKKVGVVEFSFQDILFIYAAKAKGLDPFKDINRINLGSPAGVVAAMSTNQVDACAIWEPYDRF